MDRTTVKFHDFFCDSKSKPRSACLAGSGFVRPEKFFENVRKLLLRYPFSFVGKDDPCILFVLGQPDTYYRPSPAVGNSVSKQVVKYSGHLVRIRLYNNVFVKIHLAHEISALEHTIQLVCDLLQHPAEIQLRLLKNNILRVKPRDLKEFSDQLS